MTTRTIKKKSGLTRTLWDEQGICSALLLYIVSTVYTWKGFTSHVVCLLSGGEALSRAAAGPTKSRNIAPANEFSKIRPLFVSCPDLSLKRIFSKTHRRTQRHHSWIAFTFVEVGKLLRSQLNSQILSYHHFSHPFTSIFDSPFEIKFPLPLYSSESENGFTSHV